MRLTESPVQVRDGAPLLLPATGDQHDGQVRLLSDTRIQIDLLSSQTQSNGRQCRPQVEVLSEQGRVLQVQGRLQVLSRGEDDDGLPLRVLQQPSPGLQQQHPLQQLEVSHRHQGTQVCYLTSSAVPVNDLLVQILLRRWTGPDQHHPLPVLEVDLPQLQAGQGAPLL